MKNICTFLCFFIFLYSIQVLSQNIPEFETKIYVQDARGNMDSITVGYAPNLTNYYNPEYGEIIDNSDLDSVLDIRGVILGSFSTFLDFTNYLVSNAHTPYNFDGKTCFTTIERMYIAIYAKYQPVKISWDKSAWNNECLSGSWITTQAITETAINWWELIDDTSYHCIAGVDSVIWSLPDRNPRGSKEWVYSNWYRVHPIKGGGTDTIPFVQIVPKYREYFDTPCRYSDTDDFNNSVNSIHVMPNPASDRINITADIDILSVDVYTIDGRLEQQLIPYHDGADISKLRPGIKILILKRSDGKYSYSRLVKI